MHALLLRRARPALAAATLALVAPLALAGCSGDDADPEPAASSGDASGPASSGGPSVEVPEGVETTAPGTALELGDAAVVGWAPTQGLSGVLRLRVTRVDATTFRRSFAGWQLDDRTLRSSPYFVHVSVQNAGRTDLGGRAVPLYAVTADDVLVEATGFQSTFEPCPSTPLPDRFRAGDRIERCLVFLLPDHGELASVSFRPSQELAGITWDGPVRELGQGAKDGQGGKSKGGAGGNGGTGGTGDKSKGGTGSGRG